MWPGINGQSPTFGPTPTVERVVPMLTAGTYSESQGPSSSNDQQDWEGGTPYCSSHADSKFSRSLSANVYPLTSPRTPWKKGVLARPIR